MFRTHATPVDVLYADTDAMGIVYYAGYLRFFEMGRSAYVRAFGPELIDAVREGVPVFFPVAEAHCRYRRPARVFDRLQVHTTLSEVRRASFTLAYRIEREGELLADGWTRHGAIDADGRVIRFDERVHRFLERAGLPE